MREAHSPKDHLTVDVFKTSKSKKKVPGGPTTLLTVIILNSFITPPALSPNYFESHPNHDVILSIKFPHGSLKDKTFKNSTCNSMIKPKNINSNPLVSNILSLFPFFQLSDNYFFILCLNHDPKT